MFKNRRSSFNMFLTVLTFTLLIGCTSIRNVTPYIPSTVISEEIIQNYKINEIKNINIGEKIIEKGKLIYISSEIYQYRALKNTD